VTLRNDGYKLIMSRPGQMDSIAPFPNRSTGDVLAEELRRLDPDEPYAQALGAVTGQHDLNSRPPNRVHIWKDPALASQEA
jgi:glucose-6-phosphate dehydrogenase assembly protein OpcA